MQQVTMQDRLDLAMGELNGTADDIAEFLSAREVMGLLGRPRTCPLALWLLARLEPAVGQRIEVNLHDVRMTQRRRILPGTRIIAIWELTPAQEAFVRDFDDVLYPGLIASWPSLPTTPEHIAQLELEAELQPS